MRTRVSLLASLVLSIMGSNVYGQAQEEQVIRSATTVLNESLSMRDDGIPRSLLADARAVAILPGVIRGGFVVGVLHGRGVLMVRDLNGLWRLPTFVTLTGGSLGWQAGVQSTDLILVFRSQSSVDSLMNGTLTLGGNASVAAGPLGRSAAIATNARLDAEIFAYSRSRGLFAGVAIDGSALRIDHASNAAFYPVTGPDQPAPQPESAVLLMQQIASVTSATLPLGMAMNPPPPGLPITANGVADPTGMVRGQLVQAASQLYSLLDPQWQHFLALPPEIFQEGGQPPSTASLQQSLANFAMVDRDPRYSALATRPEFKSAHGLLQYYVQLQSPTAERLHIPPPPTAGGF